MSKAPFPRIGLGSYACAWSIGVPGHLPRQPLDARGFLLLASTLGFDLVQLDDNLPLHLLSDAELDQLCVLATERGIAVEIGTRGSSPEHLLRYLQLAHRLGSPFLRILLDSGEDRPSPDECVRRLREVLPEFARKGVVLAVENHDRFRVAKLMEIIQQTGGRGIGICLDTANSLGCLEDPQRVVGELGAHVVNLHIKDVLVRRTNGGMGFEIVGAPAGAGQLDIGGLIESVRTKAAAFSATLELWPPRQASAEQTILLEREWIRLSLAYLRRLEAEATSLG